MEKKNILKGVIFVGLGAAFYGMLATFVKLAYQDHFTTAEVTTSQFVLGILGLLILNLIQTTTSKKPLSKPAKGDTKKLLLAGTSLGCTSLFYYLCVQYINVSIAIVLLMQSVWISILIESIMTKTFPSLRKVLATIIVLVGTLFATNAMHADADIDFKGVFWGFMAAISYTMTMFSSNKIANYLPPFRKSLIMLCGGSVIVALFLFFSQIGPYYFDGLKGLYHSFSDNSANIRPFDFSIFWTYGIVLALFGTIIPPILFNIGFPNAGLGLGSIVSSLELPVSVTMAFVLLGEKVVLTQWLGIAMILFAIILMNLPSKGQKQISAH